MLFFEVSHASKVRCMIHKQDPHRSGAPDEPHDAPWPVQHALLTCVHRPTRDRLGPPRRQTTCLQMRRRSKYASRPPRRCSHGGVGPPNDRGCSVRTPGTKAPLVKVRQRQTLFDVVRPLSPMRESRWIPWMAAQCSACPVDQSSSSASASQASRRAAQSRHPAIFLPSMVRKELSTRKTRDNNMLPPAGFLWGRPRGVIPRSNSALTQMCTCIQCT